MADESDKVHFITANVSLHYLFWAFGNLLPEKKDEYLGFSRLCGVNIETALSALPLHLPANDDVIVALSLGVSATRPFTHVCLLKADRRASMSLLRHFTPSSWPSPP